MTTEPTPAMTPSTIKPRSAPSGIHPPTNDPRAETPASIQSIGMTPRRRQPGRRAAPRRAESRGRGCGASRRNRCGRFGRGARFRSVPTAFDVTERIHWYRACVSKVSGACPFSESALRASATARFTAGAGASSLDAAASESAPETSRTASESSSASEASSWTRLRATDTYESAASLSSSAAMGASAVPRRRFPLPLSALRCLRRALRPSARRGRRAAPQAYPRRSARPLFPPDPSY